MGKFTDSSPFLPSLGAPTYLQSKPSVIRRYQRFHKLPETGTLNAATSKQMRATNTRIGSPPRRKLPGVEPYTPPPTRPGRPGQSSWQGTRRA